MKVLRKKVINECPFFPLFLIPFFLLLLPLIHSSISLFFSPDVSFISSSIQIDILLLPNILNAFEKLLALRITMATIFCGIKWNFVCILSNSLIILSKKCIFLKRWHANKRHGFAFKIQMNAQSPFQLNIGCRANKLHILQFLF